MAQIILGIAAILTLHSLGLIIASLVTNKWYTDSKKDIGVYGICEHLQPVLNMNDTYYYYRNKYSYTNSVVGAVNGGKTKLPAPASTPVKSNSSESVEENSSSSAGRARLMKKRRNNNIFLVNGSGENNSVQSTTTAKMSASSEIKTSNNSTNATAKSVQSAKAVNKNPSNGNTNNTKCYQLIWPDSQQAYQYLTVKTSYKITLMGVSICSVSFAVLTSIWSVICAIFAKIGTNIRSNEVLIGLSIITDVITILTFLLFLCKDDRIHHIEFYGFSFWLSVAASVGFFFVSILFILNRINLRFMYMLRNYEDQSAKSLN